MSSVGNTAEAVTAENGAWPRRLGPKEGSVFPKERKLVKTMILENLLPPRSPLKSKQKAEPTSRKRVHPTLRQPSK